MLLVQSEKNTGSDKLIWYFLILWTILNGVQAYTLEIHADEAYYWLYSRFLDWGYYDHPPMVALFIRIGDSIQHSEFGLRLTTVLSSSLSLYILWLVAKKYAVEAKWFILIISGIFIFHLYGFMTTPDAPLFLFTTLFYFVYKKYLGEDKLKWALLLAIIIAGLLYSKYHGVLLVAFTLLSNLALLKRRSFYVIVVFSVLLYIPHILWQVNHGYPSVNYHLFEQSSSKYSIAQTLTYFPGQLLMAGPFIGWFLFYNGFTTPIKDAFTRCLMVNTIGTFAFFLISSVKGEVQPQWTLIAFAPLALLVMIHFKQAGLNRIWFYRLAIVNLVFIVILRIAVITGLPLIRQIGQVKSLYGFKDWAAQIKKKAGDNYVIMADGFQNPSKYDFYNNTTKGYAYDSKYYRLTQFDIWPIEYSIQNKNAYYLFKVPQKGLTTDTLKTAAGVWYGAWVHHVRTYQQVKIATDNYKIKLSPGRKKGFDLIITNPYPYTINFTNAGYQHHVTMGACLIKEYNISDQETGAKFNQIVLKPGESTHYTFILVAPMEKGKYDMIFSIRTTPFYGSKNSRIVSLTVE